MAARTREQSSKEAKSAGQDEADDDLDDDLDDAQNGRGGGVCAEGFQRWRLHLSYDGTDYLGFQKQLGNGSGAGASIQGVVDACLSLVFRAEVTTVGASRTDRGVHARGQVCHFDAPNLWGPKQAPGLEPSTALRRLRRELPGAILATALDRAAPDFHSRLSSYRKQYSYRLSRADAVSPFEARYCWACGEVDVSAMVEGATVLSGKSLDFTTFSMGGHELHYHGEVEKQVTLHVEEKGNSEVVVLVACDRFLYKMVRRIVGALVEVGKGRIRPAELLGVDRRRVPTAPAHGLSLDRVVYPESISDAPTPLEDLHAPAWPE